jgi:exodeoxyribonuclease-5
MTWSPQQDAALKAVSDWLRRGDQPVFRLFGYAGTGKTTLAKHIAEGVDGEVAFGAYTGKAALVLRTKGCADASTIHSMIYRSRESDENGPQFVINRQSPASKADLIIIDECSMVDEELGRDLLSFGQPVLVLGDPAQLPPVKGGGFFTEGEPDVMLTEVHRQAKDNPIIHMSMQVREGGRLEPGVFGESRIIRRREIDAAAVMAADQVLVGLNKTRRLYATTRPRGCSTAAPGASRPCAGSATTSSAWTCCPTTMPAAGPWRWLCTRPSSRARRRTCLSSCGKNPTSSPMAMR